jgi:hypothetical protein
VTLFGDANVIVDSGVRDSPFRNSFLELGPLLPVTDEAFRRASASTLPRSAPTTGSTSPPTSRMGSTRSTGPLDGPARAALLAG